MSKPVRQQVSFPTVAKIRKGTPKKWMEKNGKRFPAMGRDLKNKFRIDFLSGTDDIRTVWHNLHEKDYKEYGDEYLTRDGYEVQYIRAMIPTAKVLDGFRWSNTVYNASGMKIAEADGEKFIMRKDPITMETLIKDGMPYQKFNVGEALTYVKDGKSYELKLKSSATLDLFLPELGEFVSFELRTSSYIDSLYIQKNLLAIQQIADAVNGGVAGGIPLDIYRVEMEVPYVSGGSSHKSKQWFIQIKANAEWSKATIGRMTQFAMNGTLGLNSGIPVQEFAPPDLPSVVLDESDEEEEGETPEQVIRENVTEGVVSENEFVAEETVTPEILHKEIVKLAGEKGGKANKELTKLVKSYGHGGNFKLITDLQILTKLIEDIKNLKESK